MVFAKSRIKNARPPGFLAAVGFFKTKRESDFLKKLSNISLIQNPEPRVMTDRRKPDPPGNRNVRSALRLTDTLLGEFSQVDLQTNA